MTQAGARARNGERTLVYPAEEPFERISELAERFGYPSTVSHLAAMPDRDACLASVMVVPDVDVLVRIGAMRQPDLDTLRTLHSAGGAVRLIYVAAHDAGASDDQPARSPVLYGVLSKRTAIEPVYFWLAMVPSAEAVGTLASTLSLIAAEGIDLDFLQSDALDSGRHRFFLGFVSSQPVVDRLRAALDQNGIDTDVLASVGGVQV
jgi:hypothetical protein